MKGNEQVELHGCSNRHLLRRVAKHEAGHVLLAWLLDYYLSGVIADKHGGVTRFSGHLPDYLAPPHVMLFLMAGMTFAPDRDVMAELCDHADEPEYFSKDTDSHKIAEMLRLTGEKSSLLSRHQAVLKYIRRKFARQFNELVGLLLTHDDNLIVFHELYDLYGKWDAEAGFDWHPKSDFINRLLARWFGIEITKTQWVGWDFKPMETWDYMRPSLQEIAVKVQDSLGRRK